MLSRNTILFSLLVTSAMAMTQNSQKTQEMPDKTLAIDLLRTINTAEMKFRDQSHGAYAGWNDLSGSPAFKAALDVFVRRNPKLSELSAFSYPEVINGWKLRVTISADKNSYFVLLADSSDKCSYAVLSDESGLIRQASAIGCM